MVPPWWPDERGKPIATYPCPRCGREVASRFRGFRVEHLSHVGWSLFAPAPTSTGADMRKRWSLCRCGMAACRSCRCWARRDERSAAGQPVSALAVELGGRSLADKLQAV